MEKAQIVRIRQKLTDVRGQVKISFMIARQIAGTPCRLFL
jgi:hypothetical protein